MDPNKQATQKHISEEQEQANKDENEQFKDDVKSSNRRSLKQKSQTKINPNDTNVFSLQTQPSFEKNANEETKTSDLIDSKNGSPKSKDDINCSYSHMLNVQQKQSTNAANEHDKIEPKSIDILTDRNTQIQINENDACNIEPNYTHLKSEITSNSVNSEEDISTSNFSNRIDFIHINSPIIKKNSLTKRYESSNFNTNTHLNSKNENRIRSNENSFKMNSVQRNMNDLNANSESKGNGNQTEMNSFEEDIDDYNEYSRLRPRKKSSKKLESQANAQISSGSPTDKNRFVSAQIKNLVETQLDDPIQSTNVPNKYHFDLEANPEIRVTTNAAEQPCQICTNLHKSQYNPISSETLSNRCLSTSFENGHTYHAFAGRHSLDHYNSRLNPPCHHQHHQPHSDKYHREPNQRQSVPLLCRSQLGHNHVLTSNQNIISECECENCSLPKDEAPVFEMDTGQQNSDDLAEPKATYSYLKSYFVSMLQPSDNKLAMKLFGSKKGVLKEKLRQQEVGHWIIHPCSNFR
jgi:hypothetical protein